MKTTFASLLRFVVGSILIVVAIVGWSGCATQSPRTGAGGDAKMMMSPSPIKIKRSQ